VRIIIAAILGLALAGCAQDSAEQGMSGANAWALAAANPLGPPVNCVEQGQIRGHSARDDRTIDFQMADGRLLRNRLPYACAGLMRTNRFTYRTALSRLCSVDIITLIEPDGSAGGSCGLGTFQPIALPPRQGAAPARR
jgi:hypothetical protein